MSKVQIIIEGDDAADAAANLIALVDRLRGNSALANVPSAATEAAPAATGKRGAKKTEPAAPANEPGDPFAAPAATPPAASSEPAASGASGAAPAAPTTIDLEGGDEDEGGVEGEPTYEQLSAAMNAALERVGNDPLKVQEALIKATGAKALKQLTTTGVKGGPIQPGKGAAALAAFEAIGRE